VGGICTGFTAAGLSTKIAIEYVSSCVETYHENHPEAYIFSKDIRDVKDSEIKNYLRENNISVDIVTSGMPCETFSTAGSKSRSFYDDRQYLFKQGIRIAKASNAKLILFENVPGIMSKTIEKGNRRLIIDEHYDQLQVAGYGNYISMVLHASDYGVPQFRERFFVLAAKNKNWKLEGPPVIDQENIVTVNDALIDIPDVQINSGMEVNHYNGLHSEYSELMKNAKFWKRTFNNVLSYHMPPNHRDCTIERFKLIKPGEGLKDLFDKFTAEEICEYQNKRIMPKKYYIQRNRRLLLNSISPTVTSHCLDELIHPLYDRALTVRECARLQSFPDSYTFPGGPYIIPHLYHIQDKYEQIGDAVPPLLAYEWGKQIVKILKTYKKKEAKYAEAGI
jgi:DNA (cytosine-5)-methyltransferase 1